eukprot:Unigene1749_Nuclearia_a/m.5382 Unigene1749_Nuclearia_a/g.5382  ORF Unigene1749_Nuclearia_a/g.5382 Unigene1749_Nuclearia_a/m.5382 type:complete len:193 (+) Unigene1749_Nuclearia_a:2453-3031(+)
MTSAVVAALAVSKDEPVHGVLISGINPRRLFDDAYRMHLELVASHIATPIQTAANEENRRRTKMLAELDRAKTAFFSNVSHEFRTPLTLIRGPLEQLLNDVVEPLTQRQRQRLAIVQRNSASLLKLVNSLLDFSRLEAGHMHAAFAPTDLAALTADRPAEPAGLRRRRHVGEDRLQPALERVQVHAARRHRR